MRATYMEAGNMKEADIISKVKNGIFVDTFTNGQVQIGAGDFTFFVTVSYTHLHYGLFEEAQLVDENKSDSYWGDIFQNED